MTLKKQIIKFVQLKVVGIVFAKILTQSKINAYADTVADETDGYLDRKFPKRSEKIQASIIKKGDMFWGRFKKRLMADWEKRNHQK